MELGIAGTTVAFAAKGSNLRTTPSNASEDHFDLTPPGRLAMLQPGSPWPIFADRSIAQAFSLAVRISLGGDQAIVRRHVVDAAHNRGQARISTISPSTIMSTARFVGRCRLVPRRTCLSAPCAIRRGLPCNRGSGTAGQQTAWHQQE